MLNGKGPNQNFLTKKYAKDRQEGLYDSSNLTADEKTELGISGADGGGRTNDSTFVIEQFPFPTDTTIRKKQKIDVRKVDPRIGEISD